MYRLVALLILAGCQTTGPLYDPSTYLGREKWIGNRTETPDMHFLLS